MIKPNYFTTKEYEILIVRTKFGSTDYYLSDEKPFHGQANLNLSRRYVRVVPDFRDKHQCKQPELK